MQAIADMPPHAVRLARESLRLGYEGGLAATARADLYRLTALPYARERAVILRNEVAEPVAHRG